MSLRRIRCRLESCAENRSKRRAAKQVSTVARRALLFEPLEDRRLLADMLWIASSSGNWNVAANWIDLSNGHARVPTSLDVAVFDTTRSYKSTSGSNSNATIDATSNVAGMSVANYSGTITQNALRNLTVGASGFSQAAGTFQAGANLDVNGNFTLSGGSFTAPGSGSSFTVAGNFSASGGAFTHNSGTVTFDGSGTQMLDSGAASFNAVRHSGTGTLQLVANDLTTAGTFTQTSTGTFDINGRACSLNTLTLTGGTIADTNATPGQITSSNAFDLQYGTVSAKLAGGVGLNKTTTSTVTLSGANAYTGATQVQRGVLRVLSSTSLGTSDGTTSVSSVATLQIHGTGLSFAEDLNTLAGTLTTTADFGVSGQNTWTGKITLDSGSKISPTAAQTLTVSGQVTGTGPLTLADVGILVLSNTSPTDVNNYTGGTLISSGRLKVGAAGVIPDDRVTVNGYFDLNGISEGIGALEGSGSGRVMSTAAGTATLTIGLDNGDGNFLGNIQDGTSDPSHKLALTKTGTGTQTLSGVGAGSDNSYTGQTYVENGTLALNKAPPAYPNVRIAVSSHVVIVGDGTNAAVLKLLERDQISEFADVEVRAGATFLLNGKNETFDTLNGVGLVTNNSDTGATLTLGYGGDLPGSFLGVMQDGTGAGPLSLTKMGDGIQSLGGNSPNTFTGTTTVTGGTLVLNKTPGVNALGGNITIGDSNGTDTLRLGASDQIPDAAAVTFTSGTVGDNGVFDLNGYDETVGKLISIGDRHHSITNTAVGTSTLTVNAASGDDSTFTGRITNGDEEKAREDQVEVVALTKTGTGTLTLSGTATNTYTGETDIQAGTLALAAASVNNIPASTLITVRAGAVLDVLGLNSNAIALANGQTLQGYGRVEGLVTARLGSTVSPGIIPDPQGANPGRLTTGGATFQTKSNYVVDIEGREAGSKYDQLRVNGPVTILDGAVLQTPGTFLPSAGDEFVIIDNDGTDAVTLGDGDRGFNNLPEGGVYDSNFRGTGLRAVISYVGGDGNDVVLKFRSSGFRFDFNGFHGCTAPNYVPVAPELVKTPSNTYGWDAPMESFERPEGYPAPHPTVDLLLWDGHMVQLDTVRTFQVEVDTNTTYQVSIATGDWVHPHDWQQFRAYDPGNAGNPLFDQTKVVSTQADVTEYTTVRFEVQVGTSGLLYVQIRDLPNPVPGAETNPATVILGMDVRPIENVKVITVVPPAAGALPADGLTVDTYTGSGAPLDALLTVRASNKNEYFEPSDPSSDVTASNLGTITATDQDMYRTYTQVYSNSNGDFTFDLRRPTSTGPVFITVDPAPGQHIVPAEGAGRVLPEDAFGMYRGTHTQEYVLPSTRLLDFNAGSAVTAADYPGTPPEDYVGVPLTQTYDLTTTNALGWNAAPTPPTALPLASFDRGGPDALLRDGHYGYDSEFLIDLPAADNYIVNTVIGDTSPFYHDQVQVIAEGILQTTVNTTAGQWTSSSFVVNVPADPDPRIAPQLDVRLRDAGGVDPHWVLSALRVRPAPAQGDEIQINGPADPLDANGTTVDTYTGTIAATAGEDGYLPDGAMVTVATTLGTIDPAQDQSTTYQGVQVQVTGGRFSFQIRRPSGTGGSGNVTATITAQEVLGRNLGSTTQDYQPPQTPDTVLRFDLGASATYTQDGFTHVGPRDIFSATRGYGWSTRVAAADRPLPSNFSNLNRDLHSGSNAKFRVQVGSVGSYNVRVYLSNPLGTGGYAYTYDNFDVTVEGSGTQNVPLLTPGVVRVLDFTQGNPGGDNILDIEFVDRGGQNFNWVVSGIEVSSGTLPQAINNLMAGDSASAPAGGVTIDDAMLAPLVSEAAAWWSAAGLTPAQAAVLSDLHVGVADLGGAKLGMALLTTNDIRIDDDAAGWGWSVIGDRSSVTGHSSLVTGHWSLDDGRMTNDPGQVPSGGLDLMHVLLHEIGHLLGYEHTDSGLMAPMLSASRLESSSWGADPVSRIPDLASRLDDVFADLERGGSEESGSLLLESQDTGVLAAATVRSSDEAVQARVPRRHRLERFERDLDTWFAQLAAAEEPLTNDQ